MIWLSFKLNRFAICKIIPLNNKISVDFSEIGILSIPYIEIISSNYSFAVEVSKILCLKYNQAMSLKCMGVLKHSNRRCLFVFAEDNLTSSLCHYKVQLLLFLTKKSIFSLWPFVWECIQWTCSGRRLRWSLSNHNLLLEKADSLIKRTTKARCSDFWKLSCWKPFF